MTQAFILGAGLGTRLQPLTHRLPKPLVPLFHRPLAAWTVAACARAGIRRFAVNTHHLPKAWEDFSACPEAAGCDISFFHEPILLETGGGLKNIEPWIGNAPLLIHNGDIFTTLSLEKLIAAHKASGLPVTLAMRSEEPGAEKRVALDETLTRVVDVRGLLGKSPGTHIFSGVYCVNPEFLGLLPAGEIISVIPAFVELARQGKLGALVLNEGVWLDLGDRQSYLLAHKELNLAPPIHAEAMVETGAMVENSVVGPGAVIASGATVRNSVIWPGSRVESSANLESCVVFSEKPAQGHHINEDL